MNGQKVHNNSKALPPHPQRKSTPRWVWGVLVLSILAVLVYFMRDDIWMPTPLPAENKTDTRITHSYLTRPPADPKFTATITLRNLQGDNATARATRWYRDPSFSIEIEAEHLAQLPIGSIYAAWIIKNKDDINPIYIGEMRSRDTEKNIFKIGLVFKRKDFPDYKKVIITIEKVYDLKLEKRILEGDFE